MVVSFSRRKWGFIFVRWVRICWYWFFLSLLIRWYLSIINSENLFWKVLRLRAIDCTLLNIILSWFFLRFSSAVKISVFSFSVWYFVWFCVISFLTCVSISTRLRVSRVSFVIIRFLFASVGSTITVGVLWRRKWLSVVFTVFCWYGRSVKIMVSRR